MMPIVDRKRDCRRRGSSALLLKTEKMTEEVIVKLLKRGKESKNTSSTIIDEWQLLLKDYLQD